MVPNSASVLARRVGESARVIALDISTDALAQCARPGIALDLVAGDAVALPLPDQCMDVVVTRSVLIYVADKARAAKEFHRVLTKRPSTSVDAGAYLRARRARR
jgi:ubiquinone/menaquinone biosynthesis C-methylase UbiE